MAIEPTIGAKRPSTTTEETVSFSRKNKVGFVLAILLGLSDLPSFLVPTPEGEAGPPFGVLILGSLCGLVTLLAVGYGWLRKAPVAIRVGAGARILSMLLALPAFFVEGIPAGLRVLAASFVVFTLVAVALMLSPSRSRS